MPLLPLDPDELLSTTRAVRKRLDFDRPVEKSLIEECLRIDLYFEDPVREAVQRRVGDSAQYLAENLARVPVFLIPCLPGRMDGLPASAQAGAWGSVLPAVWSFMLAARARGLGTSWTTLHLSHEREAAKILGIPYQEFTQAALVPVAHVRSTDFKPAHRVPLADVVHWDTW